MAERDRSVVRHIIHVDMDAFYASVEQRDHPQLRGVPLLVGGMHRGVVCAASYEARVFGCRSAMPMQTALQRCPHAVVVAPRQAHYKAVSKQIFAIFCRYTPLVEGLSLDEAFLDVTGSVELFGSGATIARRIINDIRTELHLSASAGAAPCKFVAKIASDLRKPAGLVAVAPHEVRDFLAPLPIEKIWGVGKVAAARLRQAGFSSMGDLADQPAQRLEQVLGKFGRQVVALARGDDPRPVVSDTQAKSISHEETFAQDIHNLEALRPIFLAQAMRVATRLRQGGVWGQVVQVKIKYADFCSESRQRRLITASQDPDALYQTACLLLASFSGTKPVRLAGVGVADLTSQAPLPQLFAEPNQTRRDKLEDVRAAIGARFGPHALTRASLLKRP